MYLSHMVTIPLSTATATNDVHGDTAVATICDDVGHTRSGLCSTSANKNIVKIKYQYHYTGSHL